MGALINNGGIKNLKYINLNLTEAAISNYDSEGIHYGNQDYKNIFSIINSRVNKSNSSKLSLYNLSDYCTYYTLAGYNAWWWPIGSANPSEGNIYGGTPVSVRVTSTFGPRSAPVPGASTNHGQ